MLESGTYRARVYESILEALSDLGIGSVPNDELIVDVEDWSLEPEARQMLLAIAREVRPRVFIEVGSYRGATVVEVARLLKELGRGTAYAIEPDSEMAHGICVRVEDEGLPVTIIAKTSRDAFEHWGREEADLILVDGDHSFASALFDLAAWSTLLAPQGWLLVHDTVSRLERRFPDDYLSVPGVFDILDIVGLRCRPSGQFWEGLAVLRWSQIGQKLRSVRHTATRGTQ
jgi:hypothetical protein